MDTRPPPMTTRQPHALIAAISIQLRTNPIGHTGTVIKTQFEADLTAAEKWIIISHLGKELDRYPDDASNGR
jgi:hypothetical protein